MDGSELRTMRIEAGLSQLGLENASGVGRTYISLYENDRMSMSEEHAKKIEAALADEPRNLPNDEGEGLWLSEYDGLRESICNRLKEAPEGFLWGHDDERREEIEIEVMTDIMRALIVLDELQGNSTLIPNDCP
jgi:transcriptional regulator with XRE-family HTH domain